MSLDSTEATLFQTWVMELSKLVEQELNSTWDQPLWLKWAYTQNQDPACAQAGGCLVYAAKALKLAVDRHHNKIPKWGDVHLVKFNHIMSDSSLGCLFSREAPHGGDAYTVNVGDASSKDFSMVAGPSYRQIIDLSNWNNSEWIIPIGNSGNLFSYHFDDWLPLWRDGEYLMMNFYAPTTRDARVLLLKPKN